MHTSKRQVQTILMWVVWWWWCGLCDGGGMGCNGVGCGVVWVVGWCGLCDGGGVGCVMVVVWVV